MNYEIMGLVMRKKFGSPTLKQVMLLMASHINEIDDTDVWPSAGRLGARCEVSEKTIRRSWKLLSSGDLSVIKHVANKPIRGGNVKVWRVDLKAIKALPNAEKSLTEALKELPDNLSSSQSDPRTLCPQPPDTVSLTTGHCVPDPRTECPTNITIEEPKEVIKEQTCLSDSSFERLWSIFPKAKRRGISRGDARKIANKVLRKTDVETLISAAGNCYSQPDSQKEDGQYAPAISKFFNKGLWENWIPKKPDLISAAEQPDELDQLFEVFAKTGRWHGERRGYLHAPDHPKAEYDESYYQRHGVQRRAA